MRPKFKNEIIIIIIISSSSSSSITIITTNYYILQIFTIIYLKQTELSSITQLWFQQNI